MVTLRGSRTGYLWGDIILPTTFLMLSWPPVGPGPGGCGVVDVLGDRPAAQALFSPWGMAGSS